MQVLGGFSQDSLHSTAWNLRNLQLRKIFSNIQFIWW